MHTLFTVVEIVLIGSHPPTASKERRMCLKGFSAEISIKTPPRKTTKFGREGKGQKISPVDRGDSRAVRPRGSRASGKVTGARRQRDPRRPARGQLVQHAWFGGEEETYLA